MLRLSNRIDNLKPSPIREILSVIDKPGMISFAGGLPALESMPKLELGAMPQQYLQYGESAGEPELRELICADMCAQGLFCTVDQVLILSGSQQGIDLVAKLFIDEGSAVAVESPTYLAALQVFKLFGADFKGFHYSDKELADAHKSLRLLYAIPTFQNPSGYCYSIEERQDLADFCESNQVPLFEDDPYRELAFDSCCTTPVCSFMKEGTWIYQSSFSKTFVPGMRLGYMICSNDLMRPLSRLKQAADLHSSRISQWLTIALLKDKSRGRRLAQLRDFYSKRRDSFAKNLDEHFADLATWKIPPGGLFFWLRLNRKMDLNKVLKEALKLNVAFMPGDHFFSNDECDAVLDSYLRLNFSYANEENAQRGLAILANLIRNA
ncbi:MAG: DNA-binding transcriptional MocR family regulator [Pseudohongiellaceae bacterium]|jgi:2-aminoadipate transaminase